MSPFMNETTTNFYDIPTFNFLLAKYGYNDITLPPEERVMVFFDSDTDTLVELKETDDMQSSYKFLKTKYIKTDDYQKLSDKKDSIYQDVSEAYYNMQKLVFRNKLKSELNIDDVRIDKLFGIAYTIAYDKGHSAGYDEVTSHLHSEAHNCIDYLKAVMV